MEILDIIKESFIFPSQNLEKLALYIVITFLIGILSAGSLASIVIALPQNHVPILAIIFTIITVIASFIITGYQVDLLKTGIKQDENAPSFVWKDNLVTGIKMLIVGIVYFIIPTVITIIMSLITNIPGQFINIAQNTVLSSTNVTTVANATSPVLGTISDVALANLMGSITITSVVALILFTIFAFLETMGESRLANTGDLSEALNIVEAGKDIGRIGIGKVLAVIILVVIIVTIINMIFNYIYGQIPQLTILSIIISPYLVFFTQRAKGLLYSNIA